MNRYAAGGPSKATSSTLCQKCLKRGHFSYECKASQQDRPYISRPSRTQQLANPKLATKITNAKPIEEPAKTSVSSIIKSSAASRERKRSFDDVDAPHRRSPSVSSNSSGDSISTISTNRSRSRSRSPPRRRDHASGSHRGESDRHRSHSKEHSRRDRTSAKPRASSRRSRSPPRRHGQRSPFDDGRPRRRDQPAQRSRSRSPYRRPQSDAPDRGVAPPHQQDRAPPAMQRERSLSPFSKRQALTRAQNGGY